MCAPSAAAGGAVTGLVDSERVRDSGGEGLHDAGRVENDSDQHSQHDELDESGDLPGEEEEQGHDPDDAEKKRPEQALKVGVEALGTQGGRRSRGPEVERHY